MSAASVIDWNALGKVVLYSLVAGLGVPAVYSIAVLGAARSTDAQRERRGGQASVYAIVALVCGVACLAAIGYGVYLLTQKS
jgi:hypothetical protein